MKTIKGRSFLKLSDFTPQEVSGLLDLASALKAEKKERRERQRLQGMNFALVFEKDSTRTRCAFEVAAFDQGARVTYLGPTGSQMGKKESAADTAKVLGRMYDAIGYRGYGQRIVEELALHAGVPVWNGLTTESHPTQALADLLTIREHSDKPLNEVKICFVGDAQNNVACSLMAAAALMGMDFRAVCPKECAPGAELVSWCRDTAAKTGAKISITENIQQGVKGCDFVYTDVWVSMGEPDAVWQQRIELLTPYRVDAALMAATGNPEAKFLHCLPAFHDTKTTVGKQIGEKFGLDCMEVADEVFLSPASLVFDQAENRLHTIKAVMAATLCDEV